jgi:hypothetical protein
MKSAPFPIVRLALLNTKIQTATAESFSGADLNGIMGQPDVIKPLYLKGILVFSPVSKVVRSSARKSRLIAVSRRFATFQVSADEVNRGE